MSVWRRQVAARRVEYKSVGPLMRMIVRSGGCPCPALRGCLAAWGAVRSIVKMSVLRALVVVRERRSQPAATLILMSVWSGAQPALALKGSYVTGAPAKSSVFLSVPKATDAVVLRGSRSVEP